MVGSWYMDDGGVVPPHIDDYWLLMFNMIKIDGAMKMAINESVQLTAVYYYIQFFTRY